MRILRSAFRLWMMPLVALSMTGCAVSLPGFGSSTPPPEETATVPASIAGRWLLNSPGRGQCVMVFGTAAPDAVEGTVAPQGGCPGRFFTSRKWSMQQGKLVMRDHNDKPLAQLSGDGAKFEGTATTGEPISLTR
jgi:hypothetical protein